MIDLDTVAHAIYRARHDLPDGYPVRLSGWTARTYRRMAGAAIGAVGEHIKEGA